MESPAVRLIDVSKSFDGHTAVDTLSLEVPEGCIYGFLGPNGSGKTTTIRLILHLVLPEGGEVEVFGKREVRACNDRIGYLPEERGLYRKLTVNRQLALFARLKGISGRAARESSRYWLERLGLLEWGDKKIETLSKGMVQKIQFITSIINQPDLLILDEPFSGLDPVNAELTREVIMGLRRLGKTIILSTHDIATAEDLCDRVFMIFRGRKVLDGSPEKIRSEHGGEVIRVRFEESLVPELGEIRGVESLRDSGRDKVIRFAGDPQETLKELVQRGRVVNFEVSRPSLREIFVRIAGGGNV